MKPTRISLALQGGGSHGAFTWGVLDRLLDESWLEIAAVSGTSAGAMNGAALKAGMAARSGAGGRRAARENLDRLWAEVGQISDNSVVRWIHSLTPMPRSMQRLTEVFSPAAWLDNLTRLFSPYDYGPFYSNPLSAILQGLPYPDFANRRGPALFVAATNVRTGRMRVFTGNAVSPEAVMASACLPTLFRAVEVRDPETGTVDAYYDGGYTGNPALYPLYGTDLPRDIVIVNLNPLIRDDVPKTPVAIADRVNEISFSSSLMAQLRAIRFVKRLHDEHRLKDLSMANPLIHMILDDMLMTDLDVRSKMLPAPGLLVQMKAAGQASADSFLSKHADALGHRDTFDLAALFEGSGIVGD